MTTGTLIIMLLLSVLILLGIYSVYLLSRNHKTLSGDSEDVLNERLQARQLEIEKLQSEIRQFHSDLQQSNEKNSTLRNR